MFFSIFLNKKWRDITGDVCKRPNGCPAINKYEGFLYFV